MYEDFLSKTRKGGTCAMIKKTTNVKIVLCLLVFACLFTYIACALASGNNLGHDRLGQRCCTEENCLACLVLSLREKALQILIFLTICTCIATIVLTTKLRATDAEQRTYAPVIPVCLKVKLSN